MKCKESIFREYDIRGVVDTDFDEVLAGRLGLAFAAKILDGRAAGLNEPKVAVGYDCRLSGEKLRLALIDGLVRGGLSVIDNGMGPTPQLYHSVVSLSLDGGIQVTGSHNPGDQNGFKMMIGSKTLSGDDIQDLKQRVLSTASELRPFHSAAVEVFDARSAYTKDLIERSKPHMGSRKLKIVVDGGNGVGGLVGPAVLRGLGCDVVELYTDPDGRFPNHHPDPTVLENIRELRARVVSEKADAGIAWDGDADRIGVVDEKGEPIFGDLLLVIYGRQLLKEVKRPTIIGDVKCSELMFSDLSNRGANTIMAKTGHSLIKAKLKELHAELAGEMSGHVFFAHRYYGFDDAIHSSARLVEILSHITGPMSGLLADLPKMFNTPEIRVDCPDDLKFQIAEKAKESFGEFKVNTLDGVRITFPNGWGLVRASNTQPILVMRFEADTPARLEEYQRLVEDRISELRKGLE